MSGLRVLFCTLGYPPGPTGGAERQASLQATDLVRRGHAVTVVCPAGPGERSMMVAGASVRRLRRSNRRYLRTVTYLPVLFAYLLLNARRFDLVHVHLGNLQADIAALACRVAGRPLYVKLAAGGSRGDVRRMTPVAPITRRIGLRWADRVQAISTEIEADLRTIGIPASRVIKIPNGLDVEHSRTTTDDEQQRARVLLGIPGDLPVVLYAGRFARYKGVRDLLAAWSDPAPPDATLLLVGQQAIDDPLGPLPMIPGIVVRPWLHDPSPAYAAADILVQPSHAEGMSNTILEAMARGLPVIATRVGAAEEMLDPDAGVLVDPSDPRALREAIDGLISDPDRRARIGANAVRRVRERYEIAGVVDRIEAAYRAILDERAG